LETIWDYRGLRGQNILPQPETCKIKLSFIFAARL